MTRTSRCATPSAQHQRSARPRGRGTAAAVRFCSAATAQTKRMSYSPDPHSDCATIRARSRFLAVVGNRAIPARSKPPFARPRKNRRRSRREYTLLLLPRLFIAPSGFDVTAVVGFWHRRSVLAPTDAAGTQEVFSVGLRELAQPARWHEYTVPGWHGPEHSTRQRCPALGLHR